ncbi:hypothetical protein P20652_0347 [Pseudoalteromonas sp. BSi20652]|nr:hypothetical protein P20652_0347 [Pseudoalteromonas sp. BSi20652]
MKTPYLLQIRCYLFVDCKVQALISAIIQQVLIRLTKTPYF